MYGKTQRLFWNKLLKTFLSQALNGNENKLLGLNLDLV